jgi:hypothetical protein
MNIDQELYEIETEQPPQEEIKMPFEREYDIAKHLLATAKYEGKAINEDSPRANNNPLELQATRCAARLINRLELGQKMYGWDFKHLIPFFEQDRAIIDVTGRGKHGWVSSLTKSNISIQHAEQLSNEISSDFDQQAEQSITSKIQSRIPFLKSREM